MCFRILFVCHKLCDNYTNLKTNMQIIMDDYYCPVKFYENYLFRIPLRPAPRMPGSLNFNYFDKTIYDTCPETRTAMCSWKTIFKIQKCIFLWDGNVFILFFRVVRVFRGKKNCVYFFRVLSSSSHRSLMSL